MEMDIIKNSKIFYEEIFECLKNNNYMIEATDKINYPHENQWESIDEEIRNIYNMIYTIYCDTYDYHHMLNYFGTEKESLDPEKYKHFYFEGKNIFLIKLSQIETNKLKIEIPVERFINKKNLNEISLNDLKDIRKYY